MIKRLLILTLNIMFALGVMMPAAHADKEVVQKVLKKTDRIEKTAIEYLEEAQTLKRQIQSELQGIKGTIAKAKNFANAVASGDIAGAISSGTALGSDLNLGDGFMSEMEALQNNYEAGSQLYNSGSAMAGQASGAFNQASGLLSKANGLINSPLDQIVNNVPGFIQDINDLESTVADVEKNVMAEVSVIENSIAHQEHEEKINDILREKMATIYAQALVTRSKIADEKAEKPEEIDTTNERALISASVDSVTQIAVRLNNIYQMESAMMEYATIKEGGKSGQRVKEE